MFRIVILDRALKQIDAITNYISTELHNPDVAAITYMKRNQENEPQSII